ncbi:MAG TPA: YsnF/AvaK domain-containing protein [Candidatus Angelobacter sp.]|nr:YsnF/AvaK domain-containing protein [Candidatus Angelobacter sp.]
MAYEKIVAVYDKSGKAKEAARALEASGFPSSEISVLNRESLTESEIHEGGLWRRLFGRNVGDHESAVYGRTIESGGAVLTLRTSDTEIPRAMKILDVHNPVDVDERATSLGVAPSADTRSAVMSTSPTARTTAKEEVLRLVEEQLDVGKRQVETGKARIRRFVTERPVEAHVTLHEEHAEMLRRAVSDPSLARDVDWSDKTIEISETAEQAVVNKTAHVAEEVVIRKEGSDHVETVRGTVRRQQVELQRVPNNIKKAA